MSELPNCPQCASAYTYLDQDLLVCPECGYEWREGDVPDDAIVDSNGNVLNSGDTVVVVKDLKVKGSSAVIKVGTKVKNIQLVDGDHPIDCKIDGVGATKLTPKVVKKV